MIGRTRYIAALVLGLLGLGETARAQEESSARLWRSAYYLGRGDTGIALADDEEAIFYNPAGLAQGKGIYKKAVLASPHIEFSQASKDLARKLLAEDSDTVDAVLSNIGKPNHVGVYNFTGLILRRAAIGAFASSNIDLLASKSKDAGGLERVDAKAAANAGLTFSLAEGFFQNKLMLGVTAKYFQRGLGAIGASAADADQVREMVGDQSQFLGMGEGGGADVGLMFQGGGRMNPSFGITVNDVGDSKVTPTEVNELDLDVKQTVNVGVALEPGTRFSKFRLLLDYRDVMSRVYTNPRKKIHLGGELGVLGLVGVTAGLNQGYATAGFYIDLWAVRLDAGMYTEEVGERVGARGDTRYFLRIRTGF